MVYRRTKTPTILQMEASECGAAALAIIMAYYGCYVPLEKLRNECGVSRDGSNALNLVTVARRYGFEASGAKTEDIRTFEDKELVLPVILHWKFNHFVVLEGVKGHRYYINDPATGPRVIDYDEMDNHFTGVLLLFEPGPEFKTQGKPPSLLTAIRQRIIGSHSALTFIFLATLALVIPGVVIPAFSKIFIDDILIHGRDLWFVPLLFGMLLTGLLRALLSWLQQFYLLRLQIKLLLVNASKYIWHILRLPLLFFSQRFAGDIVERIRANDRISDLLSSGLSTNIVDLIAVLFFGVVMLLLSWQLTFIVLFFTSLSITVFLMIARKMEDLSRRFLQEQGQLRGIEMNGLQLIETLKSTAGEDSFFSHWAGQHAKTINSQQAIMIYNQVIAILPGLLFGLNTVLILAVGAHQIMQGWLTVGTLVAFQSLSASFIGPINNIIRLASQVQRIRGDLTRLDDVLNYPEDQRLSITTKSQPKKLSGAIDVKQLTFHYSSVLPAVLRDITFQIKPKQRIAIVGATGSGKSTLARLLVGLLAPSQGSIEYDQQLLSQLSQQTIVDSIGYVDQDIFLMSGSVADNLTLWCDDYSAAQLQQTLQDVCAWEFLISRGGLQAQVQEAGRNFSGGQQQRIDIARALVHSPSILLLDEATSSLDPVVEARIVQQLKRRDCTLILVTHRLSAIRDCDQIIVLDKGQIVSTGTHVSLQQQSRIYQQLIGLEM